MQRERHLSSSGRASPLIAASHESSAVSGSISRKSTPPPAKRGNQNLPQPLLHPFLFGMEAQYGVKDEPEGPVAILDIVIPRVRIDVLVDQAPSLRTLGHARRSPEWARQRRGVPDLQHTGLDAKTLVIDSIPRTPSIVGVNAQLAPAEASNS